MTRRRLIAFAVSLIVVLAAGAAAGTWVWLETRPMTKLGSAEVEFIPSEEPGVGRVPAAVDEEIPWPTYGFDDERTHFAAGMELRPPFERLWVVDAGGVIEFPAVVENGRVFVSQGGGRVFALDADTGKILWDRTYPHCAAASPTIADGVVYQSFLPSCPNGSRDALGLIVALDARSGRELWRYRGSPSESSLLILGRLAYFGAWDGKVYALDVETRRVRWTAETDAEIDGSVAYSRGSIFVGTNGGSVYALDAQTGSILWRGRSYSGFRFGREYFYATPAAAYGRVFAPNTDGTLYAFGARTGDLLWAQPAGSYIYTAPAVWRQTVYVGSYDGNFYAFDAATGRLRWKWEGWGSIHGAPTVMDGLVYFSICGNCGRDGARYAKQGPQGTVALDATTGKLVWKFADGRYSPIVADGRRVYMTGKWRVWGLEPCSLPPPTPDPAKPYEGLLDECSASGSTAPRSP